MARLVSCLMGDIKVAEVKIFPMWMLLGHGYNSIKLTISGTGVTVYFPLVSKAVSGYFVLGSGNGLAGANRFDFNLVWYRIASKDMECIAKIRNSNYE